MQVGVEYENAKPMRIQHVTVIAGVQQKEKVDPVVLREHLVKHVITPVFAEEPLDIDESTKIYVNPQGAFPKSGPAYHSGMTGRKSAADTYGGYARHNGAALSGKDPRASTAWATTPPAMPPRTSSRRAWRKSARCN